MAGTAISQFGQQHVARTRRIRGGVALGALGLLVRGVIEPAVRHVARGQGDRDHAGLAVLPQRRVALAADPVLRQRALDETAGAARRGEVGIVDMRRSIVARSAASGYDRMRIRPDHREIRDHLRDIAVLELAEGVTHLVVDEAVAGFAILLHRDRLEADPVFAGMVAIGADEAAVAIALLAGERHRHLGNAAARIEVDFVLKGEAIVLARIGIERHPLDRLGDRIGHHCGGELRVNPPEIGSIAQPGIGQPVFE